MTFETRDSLGDDLRRGRDEARGLGEEAGQIAQDLRDLLRSEVQLAKAETREQINLAIRSAIWGAVAALCALLALVFVALTIMFALWVVLPMWLSALIVTAGLFVIAGLAGLMAYARIKQISVVPKRTVSSLKEDVAWAKAQLKSSTT